MLRRVLVAVLGVALAASMLSGCQTIEPMAGRGAAPSAQATPAFTGNLRTLMIPMPDGVIEIVGHGTSGPLGARQAARIVDPVESDATRERLIELGYVTGAFREWRQSGTNQFTLLLQFLDEEGASAYVNYLHRLRGGIGEPLPDIPGGVWYHASNAAQAIFHRDGIAVYLGIDGPSELDVEDLLSVVSEQYDRLPAG